MNITVNNNTAGIITEQNKTNVYTEKQTYTVTGTSNTANMTANRQKAIVSNGGKIVYESDHSKLTNRDKVDQHPISAITGLEEALKNAGNIKEETDPTVPKHVKNITEENINTWNNIGKLTIPEKTSDLENDSGYITADEVPKYKATDNAIIEDDTIKVVTNTGYKVIDKDIQMQPITEVNTIGTNKIIYTEDEITFIIDGSNKLRRSKNGIDFDVLQMPRACKDLINMQGHNRLMALSNDGYFFYSDDLGETWTEKQSSYANADYLFRAYEYTKGIIAINKNSKTIVALTENFGINSSIKSTITPNFIEKVNANQYVWCNSTGAFKYGAGSQEGAFASLTGITINLLKRVNNITMIGLKADNKMYLLEPATSIAKYAWKEYILPSKCTVNDIIFNPYDETYYIFTDVNTYYKTKDFITFESVDKNSFRGLQGYFTSMGIQMTTTEKNYLLLAPTRTTLENKAQEWDRALNKERWVGNGLGVEGEKIYIKAQAPIISSANGIFLSEIDEWHLTEDIVEVIYLSKAQIETDVNPNDMESWFWENGFPNEDDYKATKVIFNQAGSFYDQATWETEYTVEQYEYGYIYADSSGGLFKYVKLGNLALFFS